MSATPVTPPYFICPISNEIMQDPAICADGTTFERREIEAWFVEHDTNPKTDVALANKNLISNLAIKTGIEMFLAAKNSPKRERENDISSPAKRVKGEIELSVRNLEGSVYRVVVDASCSIDSLKEKLHVLDGKPPQDQRLIFEGKQLEDGRLLSDYNFAERGAELHLVYRLGGC